MQAFIWMRMPVCVYSEWQKLRKQPNPFSCLASLTTLELCKCAMRAFQARQNWSCCHSKYGLIFVLFLIFFSCHNSFSLCSLSVNSKNRVQLISPNTHKYKRNREKKNLLHKSFDNDLCRAIYACVHACVATQTKNKCTEFKVILVFHCFAVIIVVVVGIISWYKRSEMETSKHFDENYNMSTITRLPSDTLQFTHTLGSLCVCVSVCRWFY